MKTPDAVPQVEFEDNEPTDDQRRGLGLLAERAIVEEAEIVRLTRQLSAAITKHSLTVEKDIPDAMIACRMSEFKMLDGRKVIVRESYIGNKLTDEEGLAWVEAHEGADSIKTQIVLELPKGEMETAARILQVLKEDRAANRFIKLVLERFVHQNTIAAFAKSRVEAGDSPPLEQLGVYRKKSAKVGDTRTKVVDLKGFDYK
jgi:hypothetical protein